ncbi:lantibiotic dehydratase [Pseudonocardia sp. CA-107938]|uniref:lantibiotic dehydratase n=1 Tax=Pseudonocardia sp. CA-107938 TaxID=3240021 RepID=UPI003D8CEB33
MLRLPARPSPGGAIPPAPPGTDLRARIVALAADRALMEAVEAASPTLAHDVAKVVRGEPEKPSRLRRTAVALTKYDLRMTGRATPFGLFAGIAPLRLGETPILRGDLRARPGTRPHAEWLRPIVRRLESAPEVLAECTVRTEPGYIVRDGRIHLPERFEDDGEQRIRGSIRHTRAVAAALAAAAEPIAWKALVDVLRDDLPPEQFDAARPPIEALLRTLVEVGLLLTDLEPPPGCPDPLGHLLDRPGVLRHPIADRLAGIRHGLRHSDAAPPDRRPGLRRAVVTDMAALQAASNPVQTDLRIDVEGTLPRAVGSEAERAAALLWRLSRTSGPAWLPDYHRRFVERYGTDRAVGLTELLDETRGLGPPGEPDAASPDDSGPRWRWLGELLDGRGEIDLDDAALARLPDPVPAGGPPSMELCVEILATSWDDLVAGRFQLVVGENLGSAQAGSTIARLSHLLPELDDELTRLAVDGTPPGAAQVAFRTRSPRAANIASVPQRLPRRIPVGVGPAPNDATDLPPDVLAVVATAERLHVVDSRSGERIVPVTGSMLNPGSGELPARARFLVDVGRQDLPRCDPWEWGPFRHLPHLPRVRYGRTVLMPQRWLPSTRMLDTADDRDQWLDEVQRWREQWQVPRTVHAAVSDQKMRLDLDDDLHLEVLRTELRSRPGLQLTEVFPGSGGWLHGHAGEVVVQLLGTPAAPPTDALPQARPRRRAARTAPRTPGGEWLHLKLYAGPDALRELAAGRLAEVTDPEELTVHGVRGWFFLPYRDPDPHLRVRFVGDPARMWPTLLPRLHDWTAELYDAGLLGRWTIDSYDPEIERFGGPELLPVAERVFHADSVLALQLLAARPTDPTAALSVLELLRPLVPTPRIVELLAAVTPVTARRASPRDGRAAVADGRPLPAALAARTAAVVAYREALDRAGCPVDQRERIGLTLAHLHCLRLFGTDRAAEHRVLALLHGGLVLRRGRERSRR